MRLWQVVLGIGLPLCVLGAALLLRLPSTQDLYELDSHMLRGAYFVPATMQQTVIHVIVQSGERDNTGTPGIPHYVEHLAWLNAIGANEMLTDRHTNAFTSHDATEYFLAVPLDRTEAALASLAKVFYPFSLDRDFMLSERDIILREYEARFAESPLGDYIDKINTLGYLNDPLARSVIGTPAQIAGFDLQEAKDWHHLTHRMDNAVLLVASPLPIDAVQAMVGRVFAGLDRAGAPVPIGFDMGPSETTLRRFTDARFGSGLINLQKVVQMDPPLDFAAQTAQISLLYDILDSTLDGSYAKPLRFDGKIAQGYELQLFSLSDRHYELSIVGARPDAGVSLDALHQGLNAAIAGAEIPQQTFDRVKERWLKRIEEADTANVSFDLARNAIARRVQPIGYTEYLAAARAITLADMNRFARAFAGQGRMVVDIISPP